jgi:hypothetical protein
VTRLTGQQHVAIVGNDGNQLRTSQQEAVLESFQDQLAPCGSTGWAAFPAAALATTGIRVVQGLYRPPDSH